VPCYIFLIICILQKCTPHSLLLLSGSYFCFLFLFLGESSKLQTSNFNSIFHFFCLLVTKSFAIINLVKSNNQLLANEVLTLLVHLLILNQLIAYCISFWHTGFPRYSRGYVPGKSSTANTKTAIISLK